MSTSQIFKTAASLSIALFAIATNAGVIPGTGTSSLRDETQKKDILIGSGAINPDYLNDTRFAKVLGDQLNSLSPENEMRWASLNPAEGQYNWQTIDRLVDFAEHHDMVVKGHGLISSCCNPHYLLNITNAEASRAAMTAHFEAVMHRYRGKIDRWDVVTEVLETMGGGLQKNYFYNVTSPSYIEYALRIARAANADAKLFINETLVESLPGKRQELFNLVSELVAKGTPIDGVALQMHITEAPLVPGVITDMVSSYEALGLEMAIAEMDVHTLNNTLETEFYGAVISEALSAGITDIISWGFTDEHAYTWVSGAKPLMFDEIYKPKAEFYTTHSALASKRSTYQSRSLTYLSFSELCYRLSKGATVDYAIPSALRPLCEVDISDTVERGESTSALERAIDIKDDVATEHMEPVTSEHEKWW